ncbi:serine O-acetyltransferase [Sphingomonas sp. CCH9-E2]|uniref:serine O-acetyltransferase n=1 Tax=Sphingomonas sp. CCH9-E2 TaxID=1768776 RepID=UPI001E3A6C58|nr:hypothetical protein [Sphingomonas sp. CCH9-E2]
MAKLMRELGTALFPLRLGPPELTAGNENRWVEPRWNRPCRSWARRSRSNCASAIRHRRGAIIHYRVAHYLHYLGAPLVARVIAEVAHSATGIDIHPGATIGRSFFIDHGTGFVIGETARIGDRVRIYQGVTLGGEPRAAGAARGADVKERRHPTIEDDVVIFAGAMLLGPITIGARSQIGANVAPDSLVKHAAPTIRVQNSSTRSSNSPNTMVEA